MMFVYDSDKSVITNLDVMEQIYLDGNTIFADSITGRTYVLGIYNSEFQANTALKKLAADKTININ